ncbi:hypothetical protein C7974DRAFT_404856 [Boeremia exigua]|uniref:uncharacterized protein n=1 Tax=Boeremia exigua TaxID=749465 RepID=UPI001E8EA4C2|nr:uncharacterized protein C7974DRAFT_404856 [Boeremia exigua]KAH6614305.1 hypothetical protein C7974DRAFT_404856 [Boeremia exigua]
MLESVLGALWSSIVFVGACGLALPVWGVAVIDRELQCCSAKIRSGAAVRCRCKSPGVFSVSLYLLGWVAWLSSGWLHVNVSVWSCVVVVDKIAPVNADTV